MRLRGVLLKVFAVSVFAVSAALVACGDGGAPGGEPVRLALVLPRPELAFFRVRTGPARYDIGIVDGRGRWRRLLAGESLRDSVTPALFTRISWSPDGRRLAFSVARGNPRVGSRADLYTMLADGSRGRAITTGHDAFNPVWSPNARTIVFTRLHRVSTSGRLTIEGSLWAIRLDGTRRRRLTPQVPGRVDSAGSFSPDGRQLSFTRTSCRRVESCLSTPPAVYLIGSAGSGERKLLERASDPAFSPNGSKIAFVSDRDKNGALNYGDLESVANELYVAEADGSDERRLTNTRDLNETAPSWLPQGTRIAYQRGKQIGNAEGMAILQVNADGTCARRLLGDPHLDTWYASPEWRPGNSRHGTGRLRC